MRRMIKVQFTVFIFLLSSSPLFSAYGANPTITQSETAVSLGTGFTHLGYGETQAGVPGYLDTENGNLSTTTLEYSYLGDEGNFRFKILEFQMPPSLYFKARVTFVTVSTAYDGRTKSGTPVSATDLASLLNTDLAVGTGFYIFPRFMVVPNLQAGTHYWERTIQPNVIISGVNMENKKDYLHGYFGFGIKSVYAVSEKTAASLDLDYHRTFTSQMTSSFTGDTYSLGNSNSYVVAGKITYEVKKDVNFFARISLETFGYGASELQADGTLDPDNQSQLVQYTIGAAYAF